MTVGKRFVLFENDFTLYGQAFKKSDLRTVEDSITFQDSIIYFGNAFPESLTHIKHVVFSSKDVFGGTSFKLNENLEFEHERLGFSLSNIPLKGFERKTYLKDVRYFPFLGDFIFVSGPEKKTFERDLDEERKIINILFAFTVSWYDIHDDINVFMDFTKGDLEYDGLLIRSEKPTIYVGEDTKSAEPYIRRDFPNNKVEIVKDRPFDAIRSSKIDTKFRLEKSAKILHAQTTTPSFVKNYRRQKLASYLKKEYGKDVDTIGIMENATDFAAEFASKYKVIIVSSTNGKTRRYLTDIKRFYPNTVKVIYDRSDYWESWTPEDGIFRAADAIFCSAKYLYDTIPEEFKHKAKLVPNGCDVKPFVPQKKHERKTAVFAGRDGYKVDWDLILRLAKVNPHWDINIYCFLNVPDEEELPQNVHLKSFIDENALHTEMSKCHLGLSLLVDPEGREDYARGMLPLKFFHYVNSHLSCLMGDMTYNNIPEEYKDAAILVDRNNLSLDDMYAKSLKDEDYERMSSMMDWSSRFSIIKEKIDEFLN